MATDVPIDKSLSLEQGGAVAGIASLVLAAIAGFVLINSKRNVVLQVGNQTGEPLKLISSHHVHGTFLWPPDDIPPNPVSTFSSGNVGGSVLTGTEGS